MTVGTRDERMADVDEFLNNYLRTLSPENKQKTLLMIGELVEAGFNGADIVIPAKPNETQPTEGQPWAFTVQTEKLVTVTSELEKSYNELIDYVAAIKSVCSHLNGDFFGIERSLDLVGKNVLQQATEYKYMKEALEKISTYYQMSEEKIVKGGT